MEGQYVQECESICNVISTIAITFLTKPQKNRNYSEVMAESGFKGKIKKSHFNMGKKLQRNHPRRHIEKLMVFPSMTKLSQDQ